MTKKLSLVIPCYNEVRNLPLLLARCDEIIQRGDIEIVIVNNGSTDNSIDIIQKLAEQYSFMAPVKVEKNQGYGHGILEGLRAASGEILAWTHADMQTDPYDAIKGLKIFEDSTRPEMLFVKGRRYGRPLVDVIFTVGMSFFETLLLRKCLWDINAQPTMFHRSFFKSWDDPPKDFSLDLFVYYMAKHKGLDIRYFPVKFGERAHGISHWNVSWSAKFRFIKRTLSYSFALNKRFKHNANNSTSY